MPNAAPQTEPTIKQRLRALGFGVRKPTDADLVGHPVLCGVFCRTIYRLDTGAVLGLYDAHSAVRDVLRPREAAKLAAAEDVVEEALENELEAIGDRGNVDTYDERRAEAWTRIWGSRYFISEEQGIRVEEFESAFARLGYVASEAA